MMTSLKCRPLQKAFQCQLNTLILLALLFVDITLNQSRLKSTYMTLKTRVYLGSNSGRRVTGRRLQQMLSYLMESICSSAYTSLPLIKPSFICFSLEESILQIIKRIIQHSFTNSMAKVQFNMKGSLSFTRQVRLLPIPVTSSLKTSGSFSRSQLMR